MCRTRPQAGSELATATAGAPNPQGPQGCAATQGSAATRSPLPPRALLPATAPQSCQHSPSSSGKLPGTSENPIN